MIFSNMKQKYFLLIVFILVKLTQLKLNRIKTISNPLNNIVEFNNTSTQISKEDKDKKRDTYLKIHTLRVLIINAEIKATQG